MQPYLTKRSSFSTKLSQKLVDTNSMLEHLCSQAGNKAILQEMTQYLFNGTNPVYSWDHKTPKFVAKIPTIVNVIYDDKKVIEPALGSVPLKRKLEQAAARMIIQYLVNNATYSPYIAPWLSKRSNRDNVPRIIRSLDVLKVVTNKSLVILVDAENVPDFRRYFYIDYTGEVRLSSPTLPELVQAPSFSSDGSTTKFGLDRLGSRTQSFYNPYNLYSDSDIFVLVYAHTKSPQSAWSNRRTSDARKDAADGKIK
jgi:hypothetical protein